MYKMKYRLNEEAADDGASSGDGEASGSSESTETPEWSWGEGVAGEGDRPEFLKGKYKTVADQAKAYGELEKRFGSFTGSPEEYEIGVPEQFSETMSIDTENENVKEFISFAKESGLSQEGMSKMMEFHATALNEAMQGYMNDPEAEMKALGDNAQARLNNLSDWGKANLTEAEYEALRDTATTAQGVELLESLVGMSKVSKLPDANTATNSSITPESLRELRYAKDDHGNLKMSVDAEYRKRVEKQYADFYGTEPIREIVG